MVKVSLIFANAVEEASVICTMPINLRIFASPEIDRRHKNEPAAGSIQQTIYHPSPCIGIARAFIDVAYER